MTTTNKLAASRRTMDGLMEYKAILMTAAGVKLSETVYSDWFANDAAAVAGFAEIVAELGFSLVAVNVAEVTEVIVAE